MTYNHNDLSLHPEHLADLRKSGLADETILEAQIHSIPPRDIVKELEGHFKNVGSLLAFPYPGLDGFERYKLFPPQGSVKYYQKTGTPPRLYFPLKVMSVLHDPSIPLYITEGEKKTLKAVQEGLFCIGVSGWWNWKNKVSDELISDFDLINLEGRKITLVPDNDWQSLNIHGYSKNIKKAIYRLSKKLIERKARVFIKDLPAGTMRRQWR